MKTVLLQADAPGATERAAALLAGGELVVLPTETVYGLAADAANARAVAAVFQAKERPFFDPLIVHLPGVDWLERWAVVMEEERELVERLTAAFWPGPLTLLLPRRVEIVPDLVTAGSPLVALRRSAHPVFAAVVERLGRPVAAPSANRFGRISPTTGAHALSELDGRIPLVLEAGPTAHGLESTIVALAGGGRLRVLRHGPVTAEALAEFGEVLAGKGEGVAESAPGQVAGHYAPRTALTWLEAEAVPSSQVDRAVSPGQDARRGGRDAHPTREGEAGATPRTGRTPSGDGEQIGGNRVGLLGLRRDQPPTLATGYARVEFLSESGDLREAAAGLFAALRRLDEAGLDGIVAEPVAMTGLGRAIMERLGRAVAGSGQAGEATKSPRTIDTDSPG